jgi:hypothetical protein
MPALEVLPIVATAGAPGYDAGWVSACRRNQGKITLLAAGSSLPEAPDQAKARGTAEAAADYTVTLAMQNVTPVSQLNEAGPAGATGHYIP